MKKNDLKDGMVVRYRNNKLRLFLNGNFMGQSNRGSITEYNEDLTHTEYIYDSLDIVEVYKSTASTLGDIFSNNYLTSIWKRPNPRINELKTEISQLHEQLAKLTTELSQLEAN